jgi:ABC-type Fe3+/spermidine/putrescine transport system ATPase subunit
MSAEDIRSNVMRVLDLVQMRDFADRPSSNLSGGQQQRVAVARAIAFSPEVLLFDEPLSNLDAKLRVSMRVELRELQKELGITALNVTHDQEEALAISDRVIVMNAGRIEQIGTLGYLPPSALPVCGGLRGQCQRDPRPGAGAAAGGR